MRPPNASLKSSLHSLHVRPEADNRDAWIRAIQEIAQQSHPAIALALAPLALVPDETIANVAVRSILDVLSRLDERGILWIAHAGRSFDITGSPWQEAWNGIRQQDVQRLEAFGEASAGLLCIGSVHSSGYVRQACVEGLAHVRGSLAMAFLLVRINDWVRSVRGSARLTVLGRLWEARQGDVKRNEELLENVMMAKHIETWHRDDHGPILEAIESTLTSPAFDPVLTQGLVHKRTPLRLRMYKLALAQRSNAPLELLRSAISSRNGFVRLWGAREATQRLTGEDLRLVVDIMQKDSLGIVRHEAVFALATKLPPFMNSTLIPFLNDSSPNVRFLASHYLEKNHFDVRAHYLETVSIAPDTELAAIVVGIGERGKPGDEIAVAPFLAHTNSQVRYAAVYTLGKLRRDVDVAWLFTALNDSHKVVVREAARQIAARSHIIDAADIERAYAKARGGNVSKA